VLAASSHLTDRDRDLVRLVAVRVLAAKLDGYQVLAAGLAWHEQDCPVLLFCFGSPRREQAARCALAATREADDLRIATTAVDPRITSPAGPVWLPLLGHTGGQVRLIDLGLALPDPWQDYRLDDRRFHGQVNVAIIERRLWERYEEVVAEEAR